MMGEPKLTAFSKLRSIGASFRVVSQPQEDEERPYFFEDRDASPNVEARFSGFVRRRTKSNDWEEDTDSIKWEEGDHRAGKPLTPRPSWVDPGHVTVSVMQTLDRRISLSSDQLDTLRKERRAVRPLRTRSSYRRLDDRRPAAVDKRQNGGGGGMSNNLYIGSVSHDSDLDHAAGRTGPGVGQQPARPGAAVSQQQLSHPSSSSAAVARKTPFEMFLEDDGPYSRKLYGPVEIDDKAEKRKKERKQSVRAERSDDRQQRYQAGRSIDQTDEVRYQPPRPVKKGLLWQQKDKIFSRWKERFFILTKDYIHCFKKGSSRITEMGGFVFKIKLADVETLDLVDKKGYLTISISQLKEGKVLLRTTQGLQDWYNLIQAGVYESKKRRKIWLTAQTTGDHWLFNHTKLQEEDEDCEESSCGTDQLGCGTDQPSHREPPQNTPRGINRISLVTDLLMSEAVKEYANKSNNNNNNNNISNSKISHINHKYSGKDCESSNKNVSNIIITGSSYPAAGHSGSQVKILRTGEIDSGLDSSHSLHASSDSQSDNNSGPEESSDKLKPLPEEMTGKFRRELAGSKNGEGRNQPDLIQTGHRSRQDSLKAVGVIRGHVSSKRDRNCCKDNLV